MSEKSFNRTFGNLKFSMGKLLIYLKDPNVFEVYINPDEKIWVDTFEGRMYTDEHLPKATSEQIICTVAALTGQVIDANNPIISAEIPDTEDFESVRFQGVLPPVVTSPTINIRKHPRKIFTLDEYVKQGVLTKHQKNIIIKAIHDRKNIIVAGATKSGKTTFLNAVLEEISKSQNRIIMIEDTPELRCSSADYVSMVTTDHVSMDDCLRSVLRQTPDRIVVGEVRNSEALALLDAWSTGHNGGCSTVHSNSAIDTLLRLENMISRVSKSPQRVTIGQAVDIVIYLKYRGGKRTLEDMIQIDCYDVHKDEYIYKRLN